MKTVLRTLAGIACGFGVVLGGSAWAAEKVNIGIVTGPTFVHTIAAQKFKEEVDKALPGKYDVIVHHSAALGSETQVLQQLQLGTVQMSVCTTGPVEAFVPEIKALEMPFLFSSYEASDKVLDGPIGQDLLKRFDKAGLVGMHFLDNGFRNVTNSKRPVNGPDDLKGLKIRTMESPTHLAIWRAIGANPTPMAWPITTQLQQGVLDGQENPISVIAAGKLNEAGQKYLSITRHVYSALVFVGSKAFMDKLPAADRKAFMDAAATASAFGRRHVRDNEASQLAGLKAAGMEVVENPDLAAFRAKTESVYAALGGDSKRIVDDIRKTVK
ncbi:MAG: DctP family TRAP transporter solute-binding subunit [Burkholderiales bacterium]|nr:DctP family TRAP transporter solute-binding subunit [Burkholderiales bacterium]